MHRLPSIPCKIYLLQLYGTWIHVVVFTYLSSITCYHHNTSIGMLPHQSFSAVWRVCKKRSVMEETLKRNLNSVLVKKACWLPSSHRWTVCQGNLTHTDQRPPSRPAVGGNGTEREEEEREKELITTLMLHFIIVSWARLLTLTASAWLSTERPLLLDLAMALLTTRPQWVYHSVKVTGAQVG